MTRPSGVLLDDLRAAAIRSARDRAASLFAMPRESA